MKYHRIIAGEFRHYVFDEEYVVTGIPNAFNQGTSFWISRKGYTQAYYCFTAKNVSELKYQLDHIDSYINMFQTNLDKSNSD